MFTKVLIANRGEIAVRVQRACHELGIRTVAVYSAVDKTALHVQNADEAVLLGEAPPQDSYLAVDKILHAAQQTGAQAVHPGYGFLSENAAFAQAVADAGLTFIGPSPASIRLMGDKAESRLLMQQAGVPTVPGRQGLDSLDAFQSAADAIGYPVLVKAAAGGGGKGMRVVRNAKAMAEALESARREAQHAFGDPRLLVEKYLPRAHHVEFQVFGDQHGNLLHLFERECSVQRRHQKIIEETPSPLLTPQLRQEMSAAAVAAAKAVDYHNAGTVEFIVDPDTLAFYFLEMNTRLQVEHPVTELVVGLDLVQWQIRVAAGERFPFTQEQITQRGHAIECRVYAEDPANGFLPSTGRLLRYVEPRGPGIRVDSGFARTCDVTHFYDPLIAKLIVHAADRATAIQRMQGALRQYILHGVTTNIDFMQALLAHPDFARGAVTTRWVENKFRWGHNLQPSPAALIAAAVADLDGGLDGDRPHPARSLDPDPYSPWRETGGFGRGNS